MRRREFLSVSARRIGGVVIYSLDRRILRLSADSDKPIRIPLRFFTQAEALIVAAGAARIFPSDETGPGAEEAGVAIFIDRSLLDLGDETAIATRKSHFRNMPHQNLDTKAKQRRSRSIGKD